MRSDEEVTAEIAELADEILSSEGDPAAYNEEMAHLRLAVLPLLRSHAEAAYREGAEAMREMLAQRGFDRGYNELAEIRAIPIPERKR